MLRWFLKEGGWNLTIFMFISILKYVQIIKIHKTPVLDRSAKNSGRLSKVKSNKETVFNYKTFVFDLLN